MQFEDSLQNLPRDYSGIIYLYSHGIADTADQVTQYIEASILFSHAITFNYKDSIAYKTLSEMKVTKFIKRLIKGDYRESSLAQDHDIEQLYNQYKKISTQWPNAQIVLFGVSRGAATIDTLVSKYTLKNVVAIITESEFDEMATVIDNKRKQLKINGLISHRVAQSFAETVFRKYKRHGISPIQAIVNVDISIPRLCIASKKDDLVPIEGSIRLYQKLESIGHKKLHFFIADHGAHAKIIHGPDRVNFQSVVNAFYKHYNLQHDSVLAEKGEILFKNSRPKF